MLLKELYILIKKEILLEWRQRYALSGIVLYLVCSVFLVYMAFGSANINAETWVTLFWIVMLFTAVNAVAKSFIQESRGLRLYHYTIASPYAIILSRMIYNVFLLAVLVLAGLPVFLIVLGNPVENLPLFIFAAAMGAISFATGFTMISGIASYASNAGTMMVILGFPVIIPVLLLLIKISKAAIELSSSGQTNDFIWTLVAINMITVTTSVLLFPYLWRAN
ncbi:MAG: heme exporter protein CcmB [Cyclobacteriaceae bacterium]